MPLDATDIARRAHDVIALDRASVRSFDVDGRLHVSVANISKAVVNPYYGSEIPNAAALGLVPGRTYQLLRDPGEIARSVPTWNNLQLLAGHVAVSANDPQKERVVGSTGTDAEWFAPYLRNSLVIWDAEAIKGIEDGSCREISCGYRYVPVMEPGTYEGVHYDGRMTEIVGNHVALVSTGRAGPDVVVGDEKPKEPEMAITKPVSRAAKAAKLALDAVASGKLAKDATLDDLKKLFAADAKAMDDMEDMEGMDSEETEEEKAARLEKETKDKAAKDKAAKDKKAKDKAARDAEGAIVLPPDEHAKSDFSTGDAADLLKMLKPVVARSGDKGAKDAYVKLNKQIGQLASGVKDGAPDPFVMLTRIIPEGGIGDSTPEPAMFTFFNGKSYADGLKAYNDYQVARAARK